MNRHSVLYFLLTFGQQSSLAHPGQGSGGEPCPFLLGDNVGTTGQQTFRALAERTGDGGIPKGGYQAVMADLEALMTDSQDFWPGDFDGTPHGPHYGGLFIRLAWHCSGSHRRSDGRGGCDGGRIRFDPEINWPDNTNLRKALRLLQPIKDKYGSSLSWGDLIVLSGTTAIQYMGGTILGFCGGRIDDADGGDSLILGPSPEQETIAPCQSIGMQGSCLAVEGTPLGPTTVGLIYVNPEGPSGNVGNTTASAADIRRAFDRMGFDDVETVSLIGGGHAFGKAHGACMEKLCGEEPLKGKGPNTFTSGLEGAWTVRPTTWSNDYFNNFYDYDWSIVTGPGGATQWEPTNPDGTPGPDIMMLTTDLALRDDPAYGKISRKYQKNIAALEWDFAKSWYRLTTQDMGPVTRCIGDMVPKAQPFQHELPKAPATLPNYVPVRTAVRKLITAGKVTTDELINLAYRCAFTYRATDHSGGCNGARIRFEPEKSWPTNAGTTATIRKLKPITAMYPKVSTADLIVLAGITALEEESDDLNLSFCGGYVDAVDGKASKYLAPRLYPTVSNPDYVITIKDDFQVKGLTKEEGVVLASRENVGSQYFADLKAGNGVFDEYELALLDEEFVSIVDAYAADDALVKSVFTRAWTKMMTAGRYGDFRKNACDGISTVTLKKREPTNGGAESDKESSNGNRGKGSSGSSYGGYYGSKCGTFQCPAGTHVGDHVTCLDSLNDCFCDRTNIPASSGKCIKY